MQKICSESLNDCEAKTRRRQVNKLRHIKKILEDLQKQIRNLKAVSNEELSRNMPRTSSEPTPSTSRGTAASTSERPSTSRMMEDTDDDDLDANNRGQSKLQVAKYNKLKFAIKRLSSDQPRRPPQPDQSLHRTSNRLSRVHSQLVSQMRATYRAMERKNQFQRSSSPLSSSASASPSTTSWQKIVAEETSLRRPLPLHERNKDSNPSDKSSASSDVRPEDTKKELRALSQRLEKLLREKREKVNENSSKATSTLPSTSSSVVADLDASTSAASSQVNSSAIEIDDMIPRPDPLPVDPR